MSSILYTTCPDSTEKKPLKFFKDFFKPKLEPNELGAIEVAKESFESIFPNPKDPDDRWKEFLYTIDQGTQSFTVEYQVEINANEFDQPDYFPKYEWRSRRYNFEEELTTLFKEEYYESKKLIGKKVDVPYSNKYKLEYFFIKVLKDCAGIYNEINKMDSPFFRYKEVCERPIKAIVKTIYREYSSSAPKFAKLGNDSHQIEKIIHEDENNGNTYPKPPKLNVTKLVNGIIKLTYPRRDDFFEIENIEIKAPLENFVNGNFDKIIDPIDFTSHIEAVYYLFSEIMRYSSFKPDDITKSVKIYLKGKPFNREKYYKGKKFFIEKNNVSLRGPIDQLISESLEK